MIKMPFEIREKKDKFYVVDTDTQKIRGTYDSEDDAEDRLDELNFRADVRGRLNRIPVAEMTAEEKAAAYDKLMAEKNNQPPTDPNLPPKQDDKKDPNKKVKRSAYWGQEIED